MWIAPVRPLRLGVFVAALVSATAFIPAKAANNIGSTVVVVKTVTGELETVVRQLVLHDGVAQNELISTGADAASEIDFIDGTKLRLGPRARVTLDKFVYDPNPGKGAFYLTVSEGVARFATGNMDHQSYSIATPNGSLGVRGTAFNFVVDHTHTIVQVVFGDVWGESDDHKEKDYGAGSYFTMEGSTDNSDDDDKTELDLQVALMDALINGDHFADLPPQIPETHPFQTVSPTRP